MDHRQVEWVRASIADEVGDALTDEQLDRVAHVAVKQTMTLVREFPYGSGIHGRPILDGWKRHITTYNDERELWVTWRGQDVPADRPAVDAELLAPAPPP